MSQGSLAGIFSDYTFVLARYLESDLNNVGVLSTTDWVTDARKDDQVPNLDLNTTYVIVGDNGASFGSFPIGPWRCGISIFGPHSDIEGNNTKQFALDLNRKIQLMRNQRGLAREIISVDSLFGPVRIENSRPEFLTNFQFTVVGQQLTH